MTPSYWQGPGFVLLQPARFSGPAAFSNAWRYRHALQALDETQLYPEHPMGVPSSRLSHLPARAQTPLKVLTSVWRGSLRRRTQRARIFVFGAFEPLHVAAVAVQQQAGDMGFGVVGTGLFGQPLPVGLDGMTVARLR
jgi:hypothetical protein